MKKLLALLSVLVITGMFYSCSLEGNKKEVAAVIEEETVITSGVNTTIGRKLENPYSLENMEKAKESLVSRGVQVADEITATHHYIKFIPKSLDEVELLNSNDELVLFDTPLDYELTSTGSTYLGDNSDLNPLYTAVPVGFDLPEVDYTIIEELYIPEESDSRSMISNVLEEESLKLTGNEETSSSRGGCDPKGVVKVRDRELNIDLPIKGVNVRARNWFRFRSTYTNNNGYFSLGHFRGRNVGFSIRWQYDANRFDIRSGRVGQAYHNGPNRKTSWYPTFDGGKSGFYARIFKAGSDYVNNPYGWGNRPFDRISIQAMYDGNGPDDKAAYYRAWNENVRIFRKWNNGSVISDSDLYFINMHELAHAHHHEMLGRTYRDDVTSSVKEAWAVAASYAFAMRRYNFPNPVWNSTDKKWDPPTIGYRFQGWNPDYTSEHRYNPMLIDLIDSFNQNGVIGRALNDRVSGYNVKQFKNIFAKSSTKNFDDLIREIKALPVPRGTTVANRDSYLQIYEDWSGEVLNQDFQNGWSRSSHYSFGTTNYRDYRLSGKVEAFMMREGDFPNRALVTYISDRGSRPEDIYYRRRSLTFGNGIRYSVKFKARTEKGLKRSIRVVTGVGSCSDPYVVEDFKITGDMESYDFSFRAKDNTTNGSLIFYMGDMAGDNYSMDVVLDDIVISRSGGLY